MASWDIISVLLGTVHILLGAIWWTFKSYVSEFRKFKDDILASHIPREEMERKMDSHRDELHKIRSELQTVTLRLAVLEAKTGVSRSPS